MIKIHPSFLQRKYAIFIALITIIFCSFWYTKEDFYVHDNARFKDSQSSTYPYKLIIPSQCNSEIPAFDKVYETGYWGPKQELITPSHYYNYGDYTRLKDRSSMSGLGSFVGYATNTSLHFLVDVIKSKNIKTMLDIPCGDVNWQFVAWETDSLPLYVGADIVSNVINQNSHRFAHHKNKIFIQWDFTACKLPLIETENEERPFDLIHVRDVLQHLPLEKAAKAAKNILNSGATYIIATSFEKGANVNITDSSFYYANLALEPFNFPKPIKCVMTHPEIEADSTCLYVIDSTKKKS